VPPPPYFGSAARTEILLLLAANGPLHVREIARLRARDPASTYRSVERLVLAGLVAKRNHGRRVVALNRASSVYPHLRMFLNILVARFPQPLTDSPTYRHGLPQRDHRHAVLDDTNLFGQVAKTRTLLAVGALGPVNVAGVCRAIQTPHLTVWLAANALERLGLVVSTKVGRNRLLSLSPTLPEVEAFSEYLRAVVRNHYPEYDAVRRLD